MVTLVTEGEAMTRDRGEATMWLAIATPIIMILCLILIVVLWINTNLLVALIVFGLLCGAGVAVAGKLRQRSRGL
jgi:hypothetical protein